MSAVCCECGVTLPTPAPIELDSLRQPRLVKCARCGSVADKYWSHDFLMVLVDVLLHRPPAYRHLLRNYMGSAPSEQRTTTLVSAAIGLFICDAHLKRSIAAAALGSIPPGEGSNAATFATSSDSRALPASLYSLFCDFAWPLLSSVLEFALFAATAARTANALAGADPLRLPNVCAALLLSSVGKGCIFLLMIWEYYAVAFGMAVECFSLSCNYVALRVQPLDAYPAATALAVATAARTGLAILLVALDPSWGLGLLLTSPPPLCEPDTVAEPRFECQSVRGEGRPATSLF